MQFFAVYMTIILMVSFIPFLVLLMTVFVVCLLSCYRNGSFSVIMCCVLFCVFISPVRAVAEVSAHSG